MLKRIIVYRMQIVVVLFTVLFGFVSWLSLASIRQLQGNARVINYVGIVRGATQRLVKKELQGYPDDALIDRLNSIVDELLTGVGPNNLVVLGDLDYLGNMERVQRSWTSIKDEIAAVRGGKDSLHLYGLSEDYFFLVDRTVSSAEAFTEKQVGLSNSTLLWVNSAFILLLVVGLVYYIRTVALKRRAELLGKLAYFDQLTKLPNRASCDREMERFAAGNAGDDIGVLMFDMNNLKRVNDQLGHQGGDRIIADFGEILRSSAERFGFVGRYGGDEFLSLFADAGEDAVLDYLARINERVVAYNIHRIDEIEKISFAAGYVIAKTRESSIEDMLSEADKRMYARKRQMKENRD